MGFGLIMPMGSCATVLTCSWWEMALFVFDVSIALSVYLCSTVSYCVQWTYINIPTEFPR